MREKRRKASTTDFPVPSLYVTHEMLFPKKKRKNTDTAPATDTSKRNTDTAPATDTAKAPFLVYSLRVVLHLA